MQLPEAQIVTGFKSDDSVEIAAMSAILDALNPLDIDARKRVLSWASQRFEYTLNTAGNGIATLLVKAMGDLAGAVDAQRVSLRAKKIEPTVEQKRVFELLDQIRGKNAA